MTGKMLYCHLSHWRDPMTKLAPAFSTDHGAVYNTDCFNLLAQMRNESVDMTFADPPFNLGKDYGNGAHKDELETEDYLEWCSRWIAECARVVKPGGAVFVYSLPQWAYHFAYYLESCGMLFRHWIAVSMKGTFPRGRKLYPAHYALLYFTKGVPKTFNRVRLPIPQCRHCGKDIKDYGGHRKYLNPLGLNLTDFWEDTAPARHHKFKARWHVNELKPVIPARCIEISTNAGEIVLDPFAGGGSTFEAAQKLGRHWIGTEIVECEPIRERFSRNLPSVERSSPPRMLSGILLNPNRTLSIGIPSWQESSKRSITTAHANA